jgi:hypothetical protein
MNVDSEELTRAISQLTGFHFAVLYPFHKYKGTMPAYGP